MTNFMQMGAFVYGLSLPDWVISHYIWQKIEI